jgi:hypothetical protein
MSDFVKKPCKHCPFRNDVKPYLHPDRAAEIAYASQNPYSSFPCHKTIDYDENEEGEDERDMSKSKECAGFLTLRAQEAKETPEGFEPSWELCYTDSYEMIDTYEQEWNKNH